MLTESLHAGDSLRLTRTLPDHRPADGWVLHLRLVPRAAGAQPIALQAQPAGDAHQLGATAAATATWTPGAYGWSAWVQREAPTGTERHTVASGQVTVLPDPQAAAPGVDTRSSARRALDDCRAALAAWNPTRRRYRIGGREMEFQSTADILKLITWWEQQVAQEDPQAARPNRRILTRL